MDNKKCPNCGFINFLTAELCRKCETNLNTVDRPYQESPPTSGRGFPILKVSFCVLALLFGVLAVTGVFARLVSPLYGVSWRAFSPRYGNLTVMMPSEPTESEPAVTRFWTGDSTSKYTYRSAIEGQGSALYVVLFYPSDLSRTDEWPIDKLLDDDLNSFMTATNSTLVSKKRISLNENPGLEFEIRPPPLLGLKNPRGFGKTLFFKHEVHFLYIYASEDSRLFYGRDKFLNPVVNPK